MLVLHCAEDMGLPKNIRQCPSFLPWEVRKHRRRWQRSVVRTTHVRRLRTWHVVPCHSALAPCLCQAACTRTGSSNWLSRSATEGGDGSVVNKYVWKLSSFAFYRFLPSFSSHRPLFPRSFSIPFIFAPFPSAPRHQAVPKSNKNGCESVLLQTSQEAGPAT